MTMHKIKDLKVYPLLPKEEANTIRFFIIRHGETSYNKKKIIQGHLDISLNEQGIDQSRQLNTFLINTISESEDDIFLSKDNIDAIYTSDLKRCVETLEHAIKDSGRLEDVVVTDQLRERNMGEVQGMTRVEAEKKALAEGKKSIADYGESIKQLQDRLETYLLNTIIKQSIEKNEKNVVIFSHGAAIRYLLLRLFNNDSDYLYSKLPLEQRSSLAEANSNDSTLHFGNTCVNVVDYNTVTKTFDLKLMNGLFHITDDSIKLDDTSNGTIV
ncbi:unnamed protein product [Hanseniaspora opuntiae]